MKTRHALNTIAAACLLCIPAVWAQSAATILFMQEGTVIVNAAGASRAAQQGEAVLPGERVLSPSGGIAQLRLPDGSLIGMRPGSELKLETPPPGSTIAHVASLLQGSVHAISSELMDAKKPSTLTLKAGLTTLNLQGADLETRMVPKEERNAQGTLAAGSYTRVVTGIARIGSGPTMQTLPPKQVSFVGIVNPTPVLLASASSTLLVTPLPTTSSTTLSTAPKTLDGSTLNTTTTLSSTTLLAPTTTTSTLTAPLTTTTSTTTLLSPTTSTTLLSPTSSLSTTTLQTTTTQPITTTTSTTLISTQPTYIQPVYIKPTTCITSTLTVCK